MQAKRIILTRIAAIAAVNMTIFVQTGYQVAAIDNNYRDSSDVTKSYIEEDLEAILAGEAIKEARTKAIGCTIKWRKS
jgi:hypothetical protein